MGVELGHVRSSWWEASGRFFEKRTDCGIGSGEVRIVVADPRSTDDGSHLTHPAGSAAPRPGDDFIEEFTHAPASRGSGLGSQPQEVRGIEINEAVLWLMARSYNVPESLW
jgi:hypothetical protein